MKQSKKKKGSKVSKKEKAKSPAASSESSNENVGRVLKNLTETFASVSLEKTAYAYNEANVDPNRAAQILASVVGSAVAEDHSTSCSSSSANYNMDTSSSSSGNYSLDTSSSSSASELFVQANDCVQEGFKLNSKVRSKKVVATAGTVATMLGKDYVRSTPNKSSLKWKRFHEESWSREDKEQFLCSMLGSECELNLGVVRDVLCQCGYDFEKALDVLLELSGSSSKQSKCCYDSNDGEDTQFHLESNGSLSDGTSNSTFHPSEIEVQDNVWSAANLFRNLSEVSAACESHCLKETGNSESELPQEVLKSLFNMPTPKNAEHEPNTMNWRNVVKKMASLGQRLEPDGGEQGQCLHAKGDEYQAFRVTAKQHWESMNSYYQKAATAFTNGERGYASYLSEQGRLHNKMAQEADEKASQDIFTARNRNIENTITIDLHGQHIKQAMRLLKLHLLFGACVRSVRLFRVITGCGRHGVGRSKLKNSYLS
ncbi:SMR domain-containing protein At5g58720 isoform X2 [Olea europaea var. sylvestris]|uniref:SMR domain-containing protein At5g58720 isoform X2 n=1 Tax=Olea europaea var. sylvestris TaxID=158386 RepID=UPI000C1D3252|nr:SMR domain-containing protein At5g58720 isoform X2 [Olea europaea var. sylvestris]